MTGDGYPGPAVGSTGFPRLAKTSGYSCAPGPATRQTAISRNSSTTLPGRPTDGPATRSPLSYTAQYTSRRRASVVTATLPDVSAPMPSNEHTP